MNVLASDTGCTMDAAPCGTMMMVTEVSGNDDAAWRLYAMGFGEGANVMLEKSGRPAIVSVGTLRVAVDIELLKRVVVRPALVGASKQEGLLSAASKAAKDAGRALGLDNSCGSVAPSA